MRNLRCKQNFNRHLQLLFPEVENYESNVAIQLRIIYLECQKFNLLLLRSHIKKIKAMLNGRVLSNCGMHLTFSLSHGEIQNNGNHPTPQNNKCIPRAQIVNTSFHFFTFQKGFSFLFQLFLPETRVKQTKLSTRRNKQNLLHSGETKYNYSIRYHLEYCNSKPSCSCMGEVVQLQPVTY